MTPPVRHQILEISICSISAAAVSSMRLIEMEGPRRSSLLRLGF